MTQTTNALGEYLRARRESVTPAQVGIPETGVRRVPGLRREEVALLAGISADYYLRLERGRDRRPSVQVLESIARVLQLNDEHLSHLVALSCEIPTRRRRRVPQESPPPGALKLLDSLVQPAFIESRHFDIVASNALARALDPGLSPGRNQLRDLFLDPAKQALHPQWEHVVECYVASLRQAVGKDIDDPRFIELTGELAIASPQFASTWGRHEVRRQRSSIIQLDHPQVGELAVNRERLSIGGAETMTLVVYHADAGSRDADMLALLASADLPTSDVSRDLRSRA